MIIILPDFIPTNFSKAAATMIALPEAMSTTPMQRQVATSSNLVEIGTLVSSAGTLLLLISWQETTAQGLQITLSNASGWLPRFESAMLVSSSKDVDWVQRGGKTFVFTVPVLSVADALVLR